jgi:hypothetical protein
MVIIDFNSARMAVDRDGAVPAVTVGQRFVSAHLTKGFVSPELPAGRNNLAFGITGEVDVIVDTQREVDDVVNRKWTLNFIQVCRINTHSTTWTGRTRNEGEVSLIVSPPALPEERRVSLDANIGSSPFVNSNRPVTTVSSAPGSRFKVHVVVRMGDHPNMRQLLTPVQNSITRSPNFMIQLEDDSEFFTVFMVRSDKGVLQPPLAHVHWRVAYDVRLTWLQKRASATLRSSVFQFDPFVRGGPTDAATRAVLSNPVPPHTNDLLTEAGRQGILNRLNLQVSARRSLLIPNNFFL